MPRSLCAALCALALLPTCPATARGAAATYRQAAATAPDPDLESHRERLDEARKAFDAKDYAGARAKIAAAIEQALAELGEREDADSLRLLGGMARLAQDSGELRPAEKARRRVLAVLSRKLPDDHADLLLAREFLGSVLYSLGELPEARALFEKVHEVRARTLPPDDFDLARTRSNLALTIKELGDLQSARTLGEQALEVFARTLPEDHPQLLSTQGNHAGTLFGLGDLQGAAAIFERILEVRTRTLPDDHPDLAAARGNLALVMRTLGDLRGARALQEKVLEIESRTLPDDHPDVQQARLNLAGTIRQLGDVEEARALFEKVVEVYSRTLPEDHLDLARARMNLAGSLLQAGEYQGARAMLERVLEVQTRALPDDHPELQTTRTNLAVAIRDLGDLHGARVIEEKVLEVLSRTRAPDHPELLLAEANYASTMLQLGDLRGARSLQEKVLEVYSRTLPDDHPSLQTARLELATTLRWLDDLRGARALAEKVIEVHLRSLPGDHPSVQHAQLSLATTMRYQGDLAGARAIEEKLLETASRTMPEDHPFLQALFNNLGATIHALGDFEGARALIERSVEIRSRTQPEDSLELQTVKSNLAWMIADEWTARGNAGEREKDAARTKCTELLLSTCRGRTRAAHDALLQSSAREAEERCGELAECLKESLSFAGGYGGLGPIRELVGPAFELSETTRGSALSSAALMRTAAGKPGYVEARGALRKRSEELTKLVQQGATSEAYREALARRDEAQRELVALARGLGVALECDVGRLRGRLSERDAVVAYRRYKRARFGDPAVEKDPVDDLCAFVVRPASPDVLLVELGSLEPIEEAVRAWREAIGTGPERGVEPQAGRIDAARPRGEELRRLVFDPIAGALEGADRVVLALDDVLHLVPLEALPELGERYRFETRCTITELLAPPEQRSGAQTLVALGGASFNTDPEGADGARVAAILRGSTWERGFLPLRYTGLEAREIAALHAEVFGETAPSVVLEKGRASRESLVELAPTSRWLHVATHGWFASESVRSWEDAEPLDRYSGAGSRLPGEDQIRGMSPMLLCGLALAGANLPEDAVGRVPGLVTAEEIAALDLSRCELAVLSACDTNVGERRAGQGVASLQQALQMAGARSVITSLWKVPDEATRELMVDFYRRIWVDKKPKGQALWEAKKRMRDAKDDSGRPRYSTRDWAAWVLTGEPD